MTRRVLILAARIATLLSLLLLVAFVALGVRSYFTADSVEHRRMHLIEGWNVGQFDVAARAVRGRLEITFHRVVYDPALYRAWRARSTGWIYRRAPAASVPDPAPKSLWNRLGFYRNWADTGPLRTSDRDATLPLWLPAALCAAAPALSLHRRLRRPPPGHCPRCGYDLRATPDRCPECGATA